MNIKRANLKKGLKIKVNNPVTFLRAGDRTENKVHLCFVFESYSSALIYI